MQHCSSFGAKKGQIVRCCVHYRDLFNRPLADDLMIYFSMADILDQEASMYLLCWPCRERSGQIIHMTRAFPLPMDLHLCDGSCTRNLN